MALKKVIEAIRNRFYDASVRISAGLGRTRKPLLVFLLGAIAGEEWERRSVFAYALLGLGLLVALGAFEREKNK